MAVGFVVLVSLQVQTLSSITYILMLAAVRATSFLCRVRGCFGKATPGIRGGSKDDGSGGGKSNCAWLCMTGVACCIGGVMAGNNPAALKDANKVLSCEGAGAGTGAGVSACGPAARPASSSARLNDCGIACCCSDCDGDGSGPIDSSCAKDGVGG